MSGEGKQGCRYVHHGAVWHGQILQHIHTPCVGHTAVSTPFRDVSFFSLWREAYDELCSGGEKATFIHQKGGAGVCVSVSADFSGVRERLQFNYSLPILTCVCVCVSGACSGCCM